MSDVVEARTIANKFGSPVKSSHNAQAQEQEVKDCTEFLKIKYAKYKRYKIILEGVEECLEDDNSLDCQLKEKIKNIILGEQVSQARLSDNPIEDAIIGVPLSTRELTYSESSQLNQCLKAKLQNKCAKLNSLISVDNIEISESPLELAQADVELLEYRNKLVTEQTAFVKNQIDLLELLEELKNIRLKTIPEVTEKKYQECNFRTKINYLKSQLANNKYKIDIFMESSYSLKAYTEIIKDLKEQEEELRLEIHNLQDLKKKYADVSCKEYDDILKSYLQYKSSLEKKKLMYELYR